MSRATDAAKFLQNEDACPSALYVCARVLFGEDFDEYEPETLRLECVHRKLQVPEVNMQTLLAILALRQDGRFFQDANVFENTVLLFNNIEPAVGQVQRAEPEHIAWAVHEACELVRDLLPSGEDPCDYLDYEVEAYTAVSCQFDGMVAVPPCLSFCEERLVALTKPDPALLSGVKKGWGELNLDRLSEQVFQENPVGVQLALMAAVHLYYEEQIDRCKDQLDWY